MARSAQASSTQFDLRSLEDPSLNRRKLFLKLWAAWFVFFVISAVAAYFLLPLWGLSLFSVVMGSLAASLSPIAISFIILGACVISSMGLSSLVLFDKTLANNYSTNFNLYRWHQIGPQIIANAYRHTNTQGKISPWQILNIVAHLHLFIGALQLILNKAFHQLYNKKITYKTSVGTKEVPRELGINLLLTAPRIALAIPFLLILLPLNLLATIIEQMNHALYRQFWYWSDPKTYTAAQQLGSLKVRSPADAAQDAANNTVSDWISRKSVDENSLNTMSGGAQNRRRATTHESGGADNYGDTQVAAPTLTPGIFRPPTHPTTRGRSSSGSSTESYRSVNPFELNSLD